MAEETKPVLIEKGIQRIAVRGKVRYKTRVRLEGGNSGTGQKFANGTFDTLKEAREFRNANTTARDNGETKAITNKITFSEWAETWIGMQHKVRPTTITSYRTHINRADKFMVGRKRMGDMPIGEITRAHIESLVAAYAAEGKSITSSGYLLTKLRAIFREAQEEGLITRNPASRVQKRGAEKVERASLTVEERAKVKAALLDGEDTKDDAALWLLTLYGLRRSEVMGLRWYDINLTDKPKADAEPLTKDEVKRGVVRDPLPPMSVTIRRSRVPHGAHGHDRTQVGKPKTAAGARTLPIGDMAELVAALRALRLRHVEIGDAKAGWLALDAAGEPLDPKEWTARWSAAVAAAGVRRTPLHGARHTAVTLLRDEGWPDHHVAGWMGHTESIMRDNYSHALGSELQKTGAALAAL